MKNSISAPDPDAYVANLQSWHRQCVEAIRAAVRMTTRLEEVVKWGHLVYLADGPVMLIRAEDDRVLFGFWHGQRLTNIEPRLKPGGKYEMATLELREGTILRPATIRRLARAAVELNRKLGNPTLAAGSASTRKVPRRSPPARTR